MYADADISTDSEPENRGTESAFLRRRELCSKTQLRNQIARAPELSEPECNEADYRDHQAFQAG
jgi:hypothetical protein